MNLTQLRQLLRDYRTTPNQTDFESNIDRFIRQAEARIFYLVKDLPFFRRNVEGTVDADNPYLLMPTDFLFAYSLAIGSGANKAYLLNKDVNFIRAAFPDAASTGFPRFYAQFDELSFILGPTPDQGYASELHYGYQPTSIVDEGAGTSWLGDNAEDALLYGALVEAYTFQEGAEEDLKMYEGRFTAALQALKDLSAGFNQRDAYRSGQPRRPVS